MGCRRSSACSLQQKRAPGQLTENWPNLGPAPTKWECAGAGITPLEVYPRQGMGVGMTKRHDDGERSRVVGCKIGCIGRRGGWDIQILKTVGS